MLPLPPAGLSEVSEGQPRLARLPSSFESVASYGGSVPYFKEGHNQVKSRVSTLLQGGPQSSEKLPSCDNPCGFVLCAQLEEFGIASALALALSSHAVFKSQSNTDILLALSVGPHLQSQTRRKHKTQLNFRNLQRLAHRREAGTGSASFDRKLAQLRVTTARLAPKTVSAAEVAYAKPVQSYMRLPH